MQTVTLIKSSTMYIILSDIIKNEFMNIKIVNQKPLSDEA
jgi:hypothetical protein